MSNTLRILLLRDYPAKEFIWDFSDGPEYRRTHVEVTTQLCQGEGGGWWTCDMAYAAEAADQCKPDIAITLLADFDTDSTAPAEMQERICDQLHERSIPVVTMLMDSACFMAGPSVACIALAKALAKFDAIVTINVELRDALHHFTDTPAYVWIEGSEVCRRMQHREYPEGERNLIAMVRFHSERPNWRWSGSIYNYMVLKGILDRFPNYTAFAIAPGPAGPDPFLDYLGIADRVIPPAPGDEFRPWDDSIALLCRSKLAIHMDAGATRSHFLVEAAACGVPAITNALPHSARYLGQGGAVPTEWAFDEAILLATRLLTDKSRWRRASESVFQLSKNCGMASQRWALESIIANYKEEHP